MCIHDKYNFNTLYKEQGDGTWFFLIEDFLDTDRFPDITPKCTNECKEKMIGITQAIFKTYMNSICWYYHDVKIKDKMDNANYTYYCNTINDKSEPDDYNYTPQLENQSSLFPNYPNVLNNDNSNLNK